MPEKIVTEKAPAAIGPYSQGITSGQLVFTSGQIPVDPKTGKVPPLVQQQTEQAIENLAAVLEAAGCGLENIVKTTVFIRDMSDFGVINEVYEKYFREPYPARSCVEVSRLPRNVMLEIEAVAVRAKA